MKKNPWRYYHFTYVHHTWLSYYVLFLRYGARRTEFFVILDHFSPFTLLITKKIKVTLWFLKIKNTHGDTIILQKYTTNHDHMIHCSWDKTRDGRKFCFSFWASFWPFTPLTNQKIKIKKKHLEILPFYTCVAKIMITWCMVLDIWCPTDVQTDRQMDRRTEKITYRGVCPT